ncbi:hypothetical protein OUZ56_033725 [Daphnia magna]|uniref:Uncharacterized protein n=1 Tax=Daphnia magna TaxID=35525 RepID=A0ABQ9ZY60_9CRUS|nr:hypothetical protein OUZ56_033725 [Daphnia magna]
MAEADTFDWVAFHQLRKFSKFWEESTLKGYGIRSRCFEGQEVEEANIFHPMLRLKPEPIRLKSQALIHRANLGALQKKNFAIQCTPKRTGPVSQFALQPSIVRIRRPNQIQAVKLNIRLLLPLSISYCCVFRQTISTSKVSQASEHQVAKLKERFAVSVLKLKLKILSCTQPVFVLN